MLRDNAFRTALVSMKRCYRNFLQLPGTFGFHGVAWCPYGMCRSVTFCRIMHWILEHEGMLVANVVHQQRGTWDRTRCDGLCVECTNAPMSEKKTWALRQAMAIWIEL